MNQIAIKHRGNWPDSEETYILDRDEIRLIVFHGRMFFDDDVDVYGFIMSTGEPLWICTRFLSKADYMAFSQWLQINFGIISTLNKEEPPVVIWPAAYAGTFYFEESMIGRLAGAFWTFPACYKKRTVAKDLRSFALE